MINIRKSPPSAIDISLNPLQISGISDINCITFAQKPRKHHRIDNVRHLF